MTSIIGGSINPQRGEDVAETRHLARSHGVRQISIPIAGNIVPIASSDTQGTAYNRAEILKFRRNLLTFPSSRMPPPLLSCHNDVKFRQNA